jgi:hypothetical protein
MNQTFSFQRFLFLVGKTWSENRKKYLLSILAFMSLVFVWFAFIMLTDESNPLAKGLQEVTFFFSLFLVGPFFASQFFSDLGSKTKGTSYLMVPASALEKLLCSLLYTLVFFFIVFVLAFYVVDFIAVLIANTFHPSYNGATTVNGEPFKAHIINMFKSRDISSGSSLSYYFILVFVGLQSAALLGSVYFEKFSYIKTVISLTLIVLLSGLIVFKIMGSFFPRGSFGLVEFKFFNSDGDIAIVELPRWSQKIIEILAFYGFTIIFWITTYFRLKEKEV